MKIVIITLLVTQDGAVPIKQVEKPLPACVWVADAKPKNTPCRWKKGVVQMDKQRKTAVIHDLEEQ